MYQIFQKSNRHRQSSESGKVVGRHENPLRKKHSTSLRPRKNFKRGSDHANRVPMCDANEFADDRHIVIDVWPPSSVSADVTWNRPSVVTCTANTHSSPEYTSPRLLKASDEHHCLQTHQYPTERHVSISPDARWSPDVRWSPDRRSFSEARQFSSMNAGWSPYDCRAEPSPAVSRWFPPPPDISWTGSCDRHDGRWPQLPPPLMHLPDERVPPSFDPHQPEHFTWVQPLPGKPPMDMQASAMAPSFFNPTRPQVHNSRWKADNAMHCRTHQRETLEKKESAVFLDSTASSSDSDCPTLNRRPLHGRGQRKEARLLERLGNAQQKGSTEKSVITKAISWSGDQSDIGFVDSSCSSVCRPPPITADNDFENQTLKMGSEHSQETNNEEDRVIAGESCSGIVSNISRKSAVPCRDVSFKTKHSARKSTGGGYKKLADVKMQKKFLALTPDGKGLTSYTLKEPVVVIKKVRTDLPAQVTDVLNPEHLMRVNLSKSGHSDMVSSKSVSCDQPVEVDGSPNSELVPSNHSIVMDSSTSVGSGKVGCPSVSARCRKSTEKKKKSSKFVDHDCSVVSVSSQAAPSDLTGIMSTKSPTVVQSSVSPVILEQLPVAQQHMTPSDPPIRSGVAQQHSASSKPLIRSGVAQQHPASSGPPIRPDVPQQHSASSEPPIRSGISQHHPASSGPLVRPDVTQQHSASSEPPIISHIVEHHPASSEPPIRSDIAQQHPISSEPPVRSDASQPVLSLNDNLLQPSLDFEVPSNCADHGVVAPHQQESTSGTFGSSLEQIVQQLKRRAETQLQSSTSNKKRRWNRMPPCSALADPLPPFPTIRSSARLSKNKCNTQSSSMFNSTIDAPVAVVCEPVPSCSASGMEVLASGTIIQGEYAITHINEPSYEALEDGDRDNWLLQMDSLACDTSLGMYTQSPVNGGWAKAAMDAEVRVEAVVPAGYDKEALDSYIKAKLDEGLAKELNARLQRMRKQIDKVLQEKERLERAHKSAILKIQSLMRTTLKPSVSDKGTSTMGPAPTPDLLATSNLSPDSTHMMTRKRNIGVQCTMTPGRQRKRTCAVQTEGLLVLEGLNCSNKGKQKEPATVTAARSIANCQSEELQGRLPSVEDGIALREPVASATKSGNARQKWLVTGTEGSCARCVMVNTKSFVAVSVCARSRGHEIALRPTSGNPLHRPPTGGIMKALWKLRLFLLKLPVHQIFLDKFTAMMSAFFDCTSSIFQGEVEPELAEPVLQSLQHCNETPGLATFLLGQKLQELCNLLTRLRKLRCYLTVELSVSFETLYRQASDTLNLVVSPQYHTQAQDDDPADTGSICCSIISSPLGSDFSANEMDFSPGSSSFESENCTLESSARTAGQTHPSGNANSAIDNPNQGSSGDVARTPEMNKNQYLPNDQNKALGSMTAETTRKLVSNTTDTTTGSSDYLDNTGDKHVRIETKDNSFYGGANTMLACNNLQPCPVLQSSQSSNVQPSAFQPNVPDKLSILLKELCQQLSEKHKGFTVGNESVTNVAANSSSTQMHKTVIAVSTQSPVSQSSLGPSSQRHLAIASLPSTSFSSGVTGLNSVLQMTKLAPTSVTSTNSITPGVKLTTCVASSSSELYSKAFTAVSTQSPVCLSSLGPSLQRHLAVASLPSVNRVAGSDAVSLVINLAPTSVASTSSITTGVKLTTCVASSSSEPYPKTFTVVSTESPVPQSSLGPSPQRHLAVASLPSVSSLSRVAGSDSDSLMTNLTPTSVASTSSINIGVKLTTCVASSSSESYPETFTAVSTESPVSQSSLEPSPQRHLAVASLPSISSLSRVAGSDSDSLMTNLMPTTVASTSSIARGVILTTCVASSSCEPYPKTFIAVSTESPVSQSSLGPSPQRHLAVASLPSVSCLSRVAGTDSDSLMTNLTPTTCIAPSSSEPYSGNVSNAQCIASAVDILTRAASSSELRKTLTDAVGAFLNRTRAHKQGQIIVSGSNKIVTSKSSQILPSLGRPQSSQMPLLQNTVKNPTHQTERVLVTKGPCALSCFPKGDRWSMKNASQATAVKPSCNRNNFLENSERSAIQTPAVNTPKVVAKGTPEAEHSCTSVVVSVMDTCMSNGTSLNVSPETHSVTDMYALSDSRYSKSINASEVLFEPLPTGEKPPGLSLVTATVVVGQSKPNETSSKMLSIPEMPSYSTGLTKGMNASTETQLPLVQEQRSGTSKPLQVLSSVDTISLPVMSPVLITADASQTLSDVGHSKEAETVQQVTVAPLVKEGNLKSLKAITVCSGVDVVQNTDSQTIVPPDTSCATVLPLVIPLTCTSATSKYSIQQDLSMSSTFPVAEQASSAVLLNSTDISVTAPPGAQDSCVSKAIALSLSTSCSSVAPVPVPNVDVCHQPLTTQSLRDSHGGCTTQFSKVASCPPSLKLYPSLTPEGIVVKWTFIDELHSCENQVLNYELLVRVGKEQPMQSKFIGWTLLGKIKPLPLPMAVTLTNYIKGELYTFLVKAVFKNGVWQYSNLGRIQMLIDGL